MTIHQKSRSAVLVIEDNMTISQMYEALLTRWGYAVRCAASTHQALATLDDGFNPDAIVSDYNLGRLDTGVAAIQAIVERLGRTVPAIIITGEAEIPPSSLPVLQKPVAIPQLAEAVAGMLRLPVAMAEQLSRSES